MEKEMKKTLLCVGLATGVASQLRLYLNNFEADHNYPLRAMMMLAGLVTAFVLFRKRSIIPKAGIIACYLAAVFMVLEVGLFIHFDKKNREELQTASTPAPDPTPNPAPE